jgi:hypothetical protein
MYKDLQGRLWRMTIPGDYPIDMSTRNVQYSSDTMTFNYDDGLITYSGIPYGMTVGDMIYHINTGTIFVVTAIGPNNGPAANMHLVTTQQQNNIQVVYNTGAWAANLNTDTALSGYCILIRTGVMVPSDLHFGTFTSGSPNITNINRGEGNGTALTTYYANGDILYGSSSPNALYGGSGSNLPYSHPINNNSSTYTGAILGSVTNGVGATGPGGTATLTTGAPGNVNAIASGVYPLFPYELR